MQHHAQVQIVAQNAVLHLGQLREHADIGAVRRGHARRRVNLIGAGQAALGRLGPGGREVAADHLHGAGFGELAAPRVHAHGAEFVPGGFGQGGGVDHRHMPGDMPHKDGIARAGRVQIGPGGVAHFRDQGVVVTPAQHPGVLARALATPGQGFLVILNGAHFAQGEAVQIDLKEVIAALEREVAVPVDKAGQHGFAVQVHNAGRVGEETLLPRRGGGPGKDYFAVPGSDDFHCFGLARVFGFAHALGESVDFAVVVERVHCGGGRAPQPAPSIMTSARIGVASLLYRRIRPCSRIVAPLCSVIRRFPGLPYSLCSQGKVALKSYFAPDASMQHLASPHRLVKHAVPRLLTMGFSGPIVNNSEKRSAIPCLIFYIFPMCSARGATASHPSCSALPPNIPNCRCGCSAGI